jgi:hypothetical protein
MIAADVQIRRALPADAALLAPRLRHADAREIEAVTSLSHAAALAAGVGASKPCYTVVTQGDHPIGIFGVQPAGSNTGRVWLLGSEDLVESPLLFLRKSRRGLARLHQSYATLRAVADARNEVHLRWLAWCGFVHHRVLASYGRQRLPFYEMISSRQNQRSATKMTEFNAQVTPRHPSSVRWRLPRAEVK